MKKVGFSDDDVADLEAGKVVSRIIPARDDNEAFVVGVVRVNASQEAFVDGIRHIERFRNGDPVLQIGRFQTPPQVEDLAPLVVEPQDLEALANCRVGDCDVKVSSRGMEQARTIDWKAPDAKVKASLLIKAAIVQQVEAYLEQGSSAMATYNDNEIPESVAAEVEKILPNSPNFMRENPELLRYLLDFPHGAAPPGVESFLYWSKERVRKPVVSVVHVCLQKLGDGPGTGYFVAMKHIYDSHYFLANTEFFTLVPREGDPSCFYLAHALHARIDPPRRFRGFLLRRVKGGIRDAIEEDLERTRKQLEAVGERTMLP
jgi:hypothetical protein